MKIGNRSELYQETVDVLYNAYFAGELKHSSCRTCAVGNICVKASNITGISNHSWRWRFMTGKTGFQMLNTGRFYKSFLYLAMADRLIEATGYRTDELAKIEYAFEIANKGKSDEDWMFNGLVDVLEILKEIHQVEEDVDSLPKFENHYKTLTNKLLCNQYS